MGGLASGLLLISNTLLEGLIQRSLAVQKINQRLSEAQTGGNPITQAELDEAQALLDQKERDLIAALLAAAQE